MHIPKFALLGLAFVGAALLGWMLHTTTGDTGGARLRVQAAASRTASAPTSSAQDATLSRSDAGLANRPLYLTIVTADAARKLSGTPTDLQSTVGNGSSASPASRHSSARPIEAFAANTPSPTRTSTWTSTSTSTDIHAPAQMQGLSVVANGDHIVIANNGAIVSVGDNTVVRGNTGDATSSGTIAMDVSHSALRSGNSEQSGLISQPVGPPGSWAPYRASGGNPYGVSGQPVANLSQSGGIPLPGSLLDGSSPGSTGRAVGLAGYEIHSIDVVGNDNLATYDDSNLFMHRTGTLNGNTGDTDTSGLNVVDAARSFVGSGASGNADEPKDPPPFNAAGSGSPSGPGVPSALTTGGSSVSVADVNGVSTATGADSLVVGGDGVDDQGVRIHGNRNVATYDDGNVAIGGVGKVNAQIGDSDTSGTVAMGIRDSAIQAGSSFLPASQQAGAQLSDPFDGNDPDVPDIGSPQPLNARLGRGPSL
ncbi:MAG: hypothetical protein JWL83_724 [Actinomycetia bacterium]|nr:hypothetical protein [Actinomycetes bacterium]